MFFKLKKKKWVKLARYNIFVNLKKKNNFN